MSTHNDLRDRLYDYAMGELPLDEAQQVEQHLTGCKSCSADYGRLQEALRLVPRPSEQPDTRRAADFWSSFATQVEQEIQRRKHRRRFAWMERLRDGVESLLIMRRGQFAIGGLAAAMAGLALVLLLRPSPQLDGTLADAPKQARHDTATPALQPQTMEPREDTSSPADGHHDNSYRSPSARLVNDRMTEYFRKSKVLLIGIANLQPEPDHPLDLSMERSTSRALVKEARYLKQQHGIDPRARQLVDELSRILIQLANLADKNEVPGVEVIRSGIRQENMLFKIRMAEAALDTARTAGTSNTPGEL